MKFLSSVLALTLILFTGCSSLLTSKNSTFQPEVQNQISKDKLQGQIVGNIPPNSRFSPLKIGMTRAEVEKIIGVSTDIGIQATGNAWVPYYFGNDNWRTENYYKGEGRLVFNADSRLVLIDVSDNARK